MPALVTRGVPRVESQRGSVRALSSFGHVQSIAEVVRNIDQSG